MPQTTRFADSGLSRPRELLLGTSGVVVRLDVDHGLIIISTGLRNAVLSPRFSCDLHHCVLRFLGHPCRLKKQLLDTQKKHSLNEGDSTPN
jgi:hypothetical protein